MLLEAMDEFKARSSNDTKGSGAVFDSKSGGSGLDVHTKLSEAGAKSHGEGAEPKPNGWGVEGKPTVEGKPGGSGWDSKNDPNIVSNHEEGSGKERLHSNPDGIDIKPTQDGPRSENESWYLKGVGKGGEGSHDLPTGDRIERDHEGNETLTTPDGSRLEVNADGTYHLDGNVNSVEENPDGSRSVTFADGSKVRFGANGIQQVSRGEKMVKFVTPGAGLKDPEEEGGDGGSRRLRRRK